MGQILRNLTFEQYLALDQMSTSMILKGKKSMLAMKHAIDEEAAGKRAESAAMRLGSGAHAALLEPKVFEEEYVVMPDFHLDPENCTSKGGRSVMKTTTYVKEMKKQFGKENAGKVIISREEKKKIGGIIHAIRDHHTAGHYLGGDYEPEVTLTGEIEGVEFKTRQDLFGHDIADVKTTRDCTPWIFGKSFGDLGYGERYAIYREIDAQCTGEWKRAVLLAVESEAPHDVTVVPIPDIVLDNAMEKVKKLINDYKEAKRSGKWYGVDRGEQYMDLQIRMWDMEDEDILDWSGNE